MATIGVDVGGTTIKGVRVDGSGRIVARERVATPRPDPTGELLAAAVVRVTKALDPADEAAVGVVVPGIVDEERGIAVHSANIGLRDSPVRELIGSALGRPVGFGHDVRAGVLAEAAFGAGRGRGTVAFVPIGTGVSAAVVSGDGPVLRDSWAGEIGQVRIVSGAHAGRRLEELCSASAIAERAGEPDAERVAIRVARGDAAALTVWEDATALLAEALAWLTAVVAPELIVIGGGLASAGPLLLDPLRTRLHDRIDGLRVPGLVTAALGSDAAALGAALYGLRSGAGKASA